LMRNGRPVIGVIRAPQLNLEYYASERGGAFGNGQPIAASCTQHLRESIVSIGDYAVGANSVVRNKDRFAIAQALATTVERVRMFGSAALDLAWVAEGRTDGCVIMSNKPWDMAAGVLIARESGATVMDSDGTPHSVDSRHTLAANRLIAPALQKLVMDARTGVGAEADRER
ncbi:MAG: inositol monophosphatase, partial [Nocardia sp.]|nr:inositol monophosphatase [Nocardia sp.]